MDLSRARDRLPGRPDLRSQRTLLLSGLTGVVTGAGVAAFEWITATQLFERVVEAPLALQAGALAVGLLVAFGALAWLAGGASPGTADEYIRNFHQPERLSMRPVAGRMVAGVATLGAGGSLGFEGPSLYLGAVVGTAIQTRWSRLFSRDDSKVLMVAGAAAGVAAIFKAPATGAVFALEVPFRDDTARRALLPALVGSASGYLTYVAILGTEPLFRIDGAPPFDLRELGGAILLGLLCGVGARGFAWVVGTAKRLAARGHPLVRIAGAAGVLVSLLLLSDVLFGESLSTGSGYRILEWVGEERSLWLIVALLAIRTVADGRHPLRWWRRRPLHPSRRRRGARRCRHVGGSRRHVQPLHPHRCRGLPGRRLPHPPGRSRLRRRGHRSAGLHRSRSVRLGRRPAGHGQPSVSAYQARRRVGHLERRFLLSITTAINADVRTVPSDATLEEFQQHLLLTRKVDVPVVDGDRYLGMVSVHDLQAAGEQDWSVATVGDVVNDRWPVGSTEWTLEQAITAMEDADVDVLPVADGDIFVGIVTTSDIVRLDEILGDRRKEE